MKIKNNRQQISFMINLVKHSAKLARKMSVDVKEKQKFDLVTNVDLAIEKYMIGKINKKYKDYKIVSEEFNSKELLSDNCFIIDPIDGTVNFANNIAMYGIQIACRKNGKTIASVIYLPKTKDLFVASLGEGAFKNGKRIKVAELPLTRTVYSIDATNKKPIDEIIENLKPYTKHFRKFGAISTSLTMLACGNIGGNIFLSKNIWDIEPGLLLCVEAGANILDAIII